MTVRAAAGSATRLPGTVNFCVMGRAFVLVRLLDAEYIGADQWVVG
jgi:hypothetical protein